MKIQKDIKYVYAGSYRTKVFKSIASSPKIPTKIAEDCDIHPNHISVVLRQLKEHDLVYCINPEMRKGRVYKITEYGQEVINQITAMED